MMFAFWCHKCDEAWSEGGASSVCETVVIQVVLHLGLGVEYVMSVVVGPPFLLAYHVGLFGMDFLDLVACVHICLVLLDHGVFIGRSTGQFMISAQSLQHCMPCSGFM